MRQRVAALALALLLLGVGGCVRVEADLAIADDETVSGTLVIAALADDDSPAAAERAAQNARALESAIASGLRTAEGAVADVYSSAGYLGSRIAFAETPLAAFADTRGGPAAGDEESDGTPEAGQSGGISITREDGVITLVGGLQLGEGDGEGDDGAEEDPEGGGAAPEEAATPGEVPVRISIEFPGDVLDHNGTLTGRTVTWTTSGEETLAMTASSIDHDPTGPSYLWPLVIGSLATIAAIAAGLLIVIGLRSRHDR